jgi:DUF4097 and DUF4098 domain-containing protein YvlB
MGEYEAGVAGAELRPSVRVSSRSGRIEVVAESRDGVAAYKSGEEIAVEGDGTVTVSSRSSNLVVRVPEGTDVVVGTISGRITLVGRFGAVAANTVSARISIDTAERVDARTISGRVHVGACSGEVRIDAVSGRAEVGSAGAVLLSTTSGRITVDEVRGKVRAKGVSGRIEINVTETPLDVKVGSLSGRIRLTAPAIASPRQHLTTKRGSITSSLDQGDDGELQARTHSGSIRITGVG